MTSMINWFEIPVKNIDRAKKFYEETFTVEISRMNMHGSEMGFFPHSEGGGVSGALVQGEGYTPSGEGVLAYLNGGKDLNEVLQKIESAGGKVVVEKTQISEENGYFAIFKDSEDNRVGLHSIS